MSLTENKHTDNRSNPGKNPMNTIKINWTRAEEFDGYCAQAGPFAFEIRRQAQPTDYDDVWRLYIYDRNDTDYRLWSFPYHLISSAKKKP